MVIHNSNNPTGPGFERGEPNLPSSDFGRDIRDFPRNPAWSSPFQQVATLDRLQLFDVFEIIYPVPPGFQPIQISSRDNRLAMVGPLGNATIMISAAELPPGHPIDWIAGQPFLNCLERGARAPLVFSVPIHTAEGARGHMINAPLMIPGSFVGNPNIPMLPMFKFTVVLALEGCWFSFETQGWGLDLDTALEVKAQTHAHQQFKLTYKGLPLDFELPEPA